MTSSYKQFIKDLNENMIYEQISADKIFIRNNTNIQCICSSMQNSLQKITQKLYNEKKTSPYASIQFYAACTF